MNERRDKKEMSLLSIRFLAFLVVLLLLYYLLPSKWQWVVLLCANIIFYLSAGVTYAGCLVITAVSAWWIAGRTERTNEHYRELRGQCTTREEKQANKTECTKAKKKLMACVMILNFGLWIVLKYISPAAAPLGISFYTFIAMGYCIDVYRGKYPAEKSFWRFFVFLSFFPQMVQGPFSRYNIMKDTLRKEHVFSFDGLGEGILRMLWGFFKKMVIADRLGKVVAEIYAGNSVSGGIYVPVLMVCVTLQLYADFSGYMDIVAGVCRMLGIRLQENFRQPFFSRSIEEVWRRWHITLGAWFRDYVFYSISMSRSAQNLAKKCRQRMSPATARMMPSYLALAAVWTATGLWHGATWCFLIWGWMNLAIIAAGMQLAPFYGKLRKLLHVKEDSRGFALFQMIRTFLVFGFMEMFSDAGSLRNAVSICASFFTSFNWGLIRRPMLLFPGLSGGEVILVAAGLLLMLAVDIAKEKGKGIFSAVGKIPMPVRYLGYALVFYAVILLGNTGTELTGGFMYAQF